MMFSAGGHSREGSRGLGATCFLLSPLRGELRGTGALAEENGLHWRDELGA